MVLSGLPLPPPFSDALNITAVTPSKYAIDLPTAFCFGPRVFGGILMSILQQAAKVYFSDIHKQPDVLSMQLQFPRMLYPGEASITFREVHVGRGASTIHATVEQDGDTCVLGYINMSDLGATRGISLETGWELHPKPIQASIAKLATDSDPHWISYQTPYHPESWRRVQSYVKFYVPYEMQDRGIRDHWIRPSDPRTKWTNESLGFAIDISFPMLDNFFPEKSIGHHAAVVAAGLKQKKDRENGTLGGEAIDESSGFYDTPATYMSLNVTVEMHKRLPVGGVDWLFLRGRARHAKNGRLNLEVILLDETGDLVALSNQLCQIIDLRRASKKKPKL